jgi:hypothetical protein
MRSHELTYAANAYGIPVMRLWHIAYEILRTTLAGWSTFRNGWIIGLLGLQDMMETKV